MRRAAGVLLGVGWLLLGLAPACGQSADTVRLYANAKPYLNDPVPTLKALVHELSGLKPDSDQTGLAELLRRTGAVLMAQMPRIPNLLAHEEIAREQVPASMPMMGTRANMARGEVSMSSDGRLVPQGWQTFEYRLIPEEQKDGSIIFDESRRELSGQHAAVPAQGKGFSSNWLLFTPDNARESRFRFLGQQKVDHRSTLVVAFAQDPARVKLPGTLQLPGGSFPLLYQGVVWIDEETARIVRMRSDLLAPLPASGLGQLTSVVELSEVHIPQLETALWLPRQVDVVWEMRGTRLGEIHRYSKYKLFRGTAKIVPQ